MIRMYRLPALLALATVAVAAPAGAQNAAAATPAAAGPVCDVETMAPSELAKAMIARSKVVAAKAPDEGMKGIREAFKSVFDKSTAQNALGRDYMAAQFMLLAVEFGGEVQTRGNLNMPGDKAATVDLIVGADSLLKIVLAAKPSCADEIGQWREYKPFSNRVAAAYAALAANQLDSAERSAKRAMILSPDAPQPYDVFWRMYQAKGDEANLVKYLGIAVEKLATDTANAKIRSNLMFNLGRLSGEFAGKAQGERKAELTKGSVAAYVQVVLEHPASEETPFAVNAISTHWALTKDSIPALKVLEFAKQNTMKMGDMALAQAGIIAVQMQRAADAAEIFKGATTVNPYSREYLYNYAATLFDLKRSAEMLPIVTRLVALDPSNPDNILLFAYAYKGLADGTTDAAAKKAYTDSAVVYSGKSDGMKHKLEVRSFDRGKDKTELAFEIENRNTTAKSFAVELEFLDKTGAVIEKQTVNVGPVAPNASGQGKVEFAKGGVAGVRYAPLP